MRTAARCPAALFLLALLAGSSPSRAACLAGDVSDLRLPAVLNTGAYADGLSAPARIATDSAGNLYVTDPPRGAVVIRSGDGEIVDTHGGLGRPVGIAVDRSGRIYVGDSDTGSVTVYSADWDVLFQLGQGPGEFTVPSDIDIERQSGVVWVADGPSNRVKAYDPSGALRLNLGGLGSDPGLFNFPVSLSVDSDSGLVLVVDQQNRRVQIFDFEGRYLSCFGRKGSGAAGLSAPQGVWADAQGRVYVADSFEGWVKVLDQAGNQIGSIGDFGERAGQVRLPLDVAIDKWNRLFVASANNSRVEIYELASEGPVLPANVTLEPDPFYRGLSQASVFVWVQVPGGAAEDILASSVTANGVPAAAASASVGDHDRDGVADLRLEFDWTVIAETLPQSGPATVTVTGAIASSRFEGTGDLTVVAAACGSGITCSLGDADPRCNEAVCEEPLGCTLQSAVDGTSCDDSEPCTSGDTCEDRHCEGGPPPGCDDSNPCTDDSCAQGIGCVHSSNAAPCDDGDPCTTGDICGAGVCGAGQAKNCDDGNVCTVDGCEAGTGCTHHLPDAAGLCDDGDPWTVDDACQQAGNCRGRPAAVRYGVTGWSASPAKPMRLKVGSDADLAASVCIDRIAVGSASVIGGDVVALGTRDPVQFAGAGKIGGSVVTTGGITVDLEEVSVAGRVDTTGTAPELAECSAAATVAAERWRELRGLPASPGLNLGSIEVPSSTSVRIPAEGTLGPGTVVIELTRLALDDSATLILVGGQQTEVLVVRIAGPRAALELGSEAQLITESLSAEQVIFAVDGAVKLQQKATLVGTVLARRPITIARSVTIVGALFGSARIRIGQGVGLDHEPFVSW